MMGWYGGGAGPLGWLGMGVFWLVVLALIVLLVVRLLPGTGAPTRTVGRSALEILDHRPASGEIDQRTWQTRRPLFWPPGPTKSDLLSRAPTQRIHQMMHRAHDHS